MNEPLPSPQSRRLPARLSDTIAAELETRILEGSLKPGDRLPGERELATDMGVSRPSLREAIRKLASNGLLTTRHGGGTYVTDRLDASFVDPWQKMLEGHPALQTDLLEFRHMLETQAAYLAAERATDADIERLDTVFADLERVYEQGDVIRCIDRDVAFHQSIAEAAHNVLIGHLTASLLRVIHGHISRNLAHLRATTHRWDELRAQHRMIWLAVREHRPDDAARAARSHIEFVQQSISQTEREEARRGSALRRL